MKKFSIVRWIFLILAIASNGFVLAYSAIPTDITNEWTSSFTTFFASIVNSFTHKEVEQIPITELNIQMSDKESYEYNDIPGYTLNEIPLGSAKQIECTYSPEDTTDNSIQYYTTANDIVTLSPSGNKLSAIGMKPGEAEIYAENKLSGIVSSCTVHVVETVAPVKYEVSIASKTIAIGGQGTVDINIDGGVLGHSELINFRYYDCRKLKFTSSNTDILTIDNNAVIHPVSIGSATVTISNNKGVSKSLDISIVDGEEPILFENLKIGGSNVCYGNDMIRDQSSGKNHTQLQIFDGEKELNPDDFVWSSSNELLVKVDKHGVMRGFRKAKVDDETATITATSKLTNQSVSFGVIVKEQLPTSMYFSVNVGEKQTWNPTEYTACVGDIIVVKVGYEPSISLKDVTVTVSDNSIFDCTNQGSSFTLSTKQVGNCLVSFTSVVNPELKAEINFTILEAGAIATEDMSDVGNNLRKVIGHASLFAIAQIFTIITFFMFLLDKDLWKIATFSLLVGLLISIVSEIIQIFVPGRSGTLLDVLIDFSGVVVGALLVILFITITRIVQLKKNNTKNTNNS